MCLFFLSALPSEYELRERADMKKPKTDLYAKAGRWRNKATGRV
jgi:hypothetical protein